MITKIIRTVEVSDLTQEELEAVAAALKDPDLFNVKVYRDENSGIPPDINCIETDYNSLHAYMERDGQSDFRVDVAHEILEEACGYAAEHDIEEVQFIR